MPSLRTANTRAKRKADRARPGHRDSLTIFTFDLESYGHYSKVARLVGGYTFGFESFERQMREAREAFEGFHAAILRQTAAELGLPYDELTATWVDDGTGRHVLEG